MAQATVIKPGNRTYDVEGALSYDAAVTAASAIEAKAGHLLALVGGAWTAVAATADATAVSGIQALGVLLEDASLSTTAVTVRVLYAGKVWEQFVRDAGITADVTSFEALIGAPGKLVFADEEA